MVTVLLGAGGLVASAAAQSATAQSATAQSATAQSATAQSATAQSATAQSATASVSGKYVIALSNSFLGNTWRQTMVSIFEKTAQKAESEGLISGYKVENTSDNDATTQISQIKSLILEHVNALLIDAASPTALNSTIEEACKAGITVLVFDSLASAPCEHNLADNFDLYGQEESQLVAACMHGTGNVIVAQGVVGSAPSEAIYQQQLKELKKFPKIKIVSTVVGQADNATTEQAIASVLPSLPTIKGVITGGSSYGAVEAFLNAKRPLPCAVYDNSGTALRFWMQQHQKDGYTAYSYRTEPGQAAAAFWEALGLLQGEHFAKNLTFPNIEVTQSTLARWIKVVPSQQVCGWLWTKAEFNQEIAAIAEHSLYYPPIPTI
jgi:ribose transport system substrate-binding protein